MKKYILVDRGGSMVAFDELVATYIAQFANATVLYYYNIPHEYIFSNVNHTEGIPVTEFLDDITLQETSITIISDGGASRGRYCQHRVDKINEFLNKLIVENVTWLNPVIESGWKYNSAAATNIKMEWLPLVMSIPKLTSSHKYKFATSAPLLSIRLKRQIHYYNDSNTLDSILFSKLVSNLVVFDVNILYWFQHHFELSPDVVSNFILSNLCQEIGCGLFQFRNSKIRMSLRTQLESIFTIEQLNKVDSILNQYANTKYTRVEDEEIKYSIINK